jgi:hypothetical protein
MRESMRKRVVVLIYCIAFLLPVISPIPAGAISDGRVKLLGTAPGEYGYGIAVDATGNVYVTGYTYGNLDGQTNAGNSDIFIAKYDTKGTRQWVKLLGTTGHEEGYGIAADSTGNIYITGYTNGNLDGQINAGGADIFIAKYDTKGTKQWVKLLGTEGHEEGYGIVVDSTGNIHVAGHTNGNPNGQINAGEYDIVLARYDRTGTRQWVKLLGTATYEYGRGITADTTGNIYVTGYTNGNLDGQINAGEYDIVLAKYDRTGTRQWVKLLGTAAGDYGYGIDADSTGNIYVTGRTEDNLDGQTNAGGADIFVAAYDREGTKRWVKLLGTEAGDWGRGIAADNTGNIYVTGRTEGNLDGQSNAGFVDIFVAQYDGTGIKQWVKLLGTKAVEYGRCIVVDSIGNIYVTGYTNGNLAGQTDAGGYHVIVWKRAEFVPLETLSPGN